MNLESGGTVAFDFFPREVQTSRRANWEPQDITIGTKPIFYGNRDPGRLVLNELWLDRTDENESITPDIVSLYLLQAEDPKLGRPPALLAIWGDRQERVVLEEVSVLEQWFSGAGEPQRAKVSLQLVEFQEDAEVTEVTVRDDFEFVPVGP